MVEKYPLANEPGRTMVVFVKDGKFYGHIVKDKTDKAPAKFVFETPRFLTLEELKAEYPSADTK
ncbi:hypothetical protein GCM10023310_25520 [Paenibacillus vulneris]|uniref:Phage protein n=1 Tax=Paenibacillus vulneris TaxID=1133364 RepID=A0ABW3UVC7_9BACL|nr:MULTISPECIES: hypothetical protein [unclassified Paenibacillus]MBE1445468.1 hypothetical protein [Paenibacillus sp. OAS669]